MRPPIIVLGAARSGTTLVAEQVLAAHDDVAYWAEPTYVWRYGHAYRRSDVLHREEATPPVKDYIRGRFEEYLRRSGRSRFMEKTPGNVFRMPFVLEVLPDAQVIHVIRDGRDVALSAAEEWAGGGRDALDSRRIRRSGKLRRVLGTISAELQLAHRVHDLRSVLELPAYAGRAWALIARQLAHSSDRPWGPRLPGLRSIRRTYSLLETTAIQWDLSVRTARSACRGLPPDRYLELRYEALIAAPEEHVRAILDFLGLPADGGSVERLTESVVPRRLPKWPELLDGADRERVEDLIATTLSDLGYETI